MDSSDGALQTGAMSSRHIGDSLSCRLNALPPLGNGGYRVGSPIYSMTLVGRSASLVNALYRPGRFTALMFRYVAASALDKCRRLQQLFFTVRNQSDWLPLFPSFRESGSAPPCVVGGKPEKTAQVVPAVP
jgi:hypothetical protein